MRIKNKIISILVLTLLIVKGFISIGQEKVDTYSMSALSDFDVEQFDIRIDNDNNLWIDAFSTYQPETRCGITIDERYKPNFITTFENARDLYTEWKRMAMESNLQDIKQKMHFMFFTGGYFTYFDELKKDDDVKLIFAFTWFNGDYVLIMNLEEMTAADNDLIRFNGASLIFNSEEEINSFLDKISPHYINNFRASKAEDSDN